MKESSANNLSEGLQQDEAAGETSCHPGIMCPICMEHVPEGKIARPSGCKHSFCFRCLNEWSYKKVDVTCPCCRTPYTEIVLRCWRKRTPN